MLGHVKAAVAKVGLDMPSSKSGDVHFVLNGASFSEDVTQKNHMFNVKASARLKNFQVADQTYGPGQYDMEVRNIGEHVATEYFKTINDIRAMQPQGARNPKAMAALGTKLMGLADEFLKNSPEFEISHSVARRVVKEGRRRRQSSADVQRRRHV